MPFSVYIGWGLLVPAALSLLYGFLSLRAMGALGYPQKATVWERVWNVLPPLLLFTLWGIADIPLPLFYLLAYFQKFSRLFHKNASRSRKLFLINLTHLTTMALHMILIGVLSLVTDTTMNEVLRQPLWRLVTIGIVLAVNNLVAWLIPRWDMVLEVLRTQSENEETKPFMIFLWLCSIFLLLDSVLCLSTIEWKLLPLFLIGSTVLLEFYLVRFLRHIYRILKVHYLEEEHRRLMEKLEQQNQNAARLRSKIALDSMTGIFTRRYVTEQVEFLLQEKESFSLVYIDLDHLKQINDQEGHRAGDLYILRFTNELGAYLRKVDIFARVGGDEFVVLLPGCPLETAAKRMEAIRSRLTGQSSFSYGVTFVPKESRDSVEEIFHRADRDMYRDKRARTGAERRG